MITISVNGELRQYSEGIESWINEQINRRRNSGARVCVEVNVSFTALNMVLRTQGCVTNGTPGTRRPTLAEQRIFDLWDTLGLNEPTYSSGQVIAFLKQLRRNT